MQIHSVTQQDIESIKSNLRKSIIVRADYYFSNLKGFYWSNIVPYMSARTRRFDPDANLDANAMWLKFIPILTDFVFENGIRLSSNEKHKYHFTKGPRALYIIQNHPEMVDLNQIFRVAKDTFFDNRLITFDPNYKLQMNLIANQTEIEDKITSMNDNEINITFKDAVLIIANLYNPKTQQIPNINFKEEMEKKALKHQQLKESYLQEVYKYFVSRNFAKAFDESDIRDRRNQNITKDFAISKSEDLSENESRFTVLGRLNKTRWQAWIREAVFISANELGVTSADRLYTILIDSDMAEEFTQNVMRLLGLVLTCSKLPFRYTDSDIFYTRIKNDINLVMKKYVAGENKSARIFKEINDRNKNSKDLKEVKRRLKRMTKSNKSYLQLCDLVDYDVRFTMDENDGRRVYNLLNLIKRMEINESTARNFIKSVWPNPSIILKNDTELPRIQHDFIEQRYARAFNLVLALSARPAPKFHNHLLKLLTSVINSGKNTVNIIYELTNFVKLFPTLNIQDHSSIRLILNTCRRMENTEHVIKLNEMSKNGWIIDELDIGHTLDTGLIKLIASEFSDIRITTKTIADPIKEKLSNDLVVGVYPFGHYKGLLGPGVEGVCIEPGGEDHFDHLRYECLNLLIHDNECIYIWGLVVPLEDGTFFLNNIQGGLSNKHSKQAKAISDSIVSVLSKNGETFTENHYFNTISIKDSVDDYVKTQLKLPEMYLDTEVVSGTALTRNIEFLHIQDRSSKTY